MCKAARDESRSVATSQPPRGATSTQQRLGKEQRLRARVGKQINFSKQGRQWILELISKLNCPNLLREELTKQICS
jgi:hypothetical protein